MQNQVVPVAVLLKEGVINESESELFFTSVTTATARCFTASRLF